MKLAIILFILINEPYYHLHGNRRSEQGRYECGKRTEHKPYGHKLKCYPLKNRKAYYSRSPHNIHSISIQRSHLRKQITYDFHMLC